VPEPLRPYDPAIGSGSAGDGLYRVTSPYALRGDGFHAALDIGNGRLGGPVYATAPGKVIAVGLLGWPWSQPTRLFASGNYGGLMVVLEHPGGWLSLYAHLASERVTLGQAVAAGEQLGTIGDSGSAVGQGHLHFSIGRGTSGGATGWVDPWPLLGVIDMQLIERHEPWTLPIGAELWTDGPGLGSRKVVTVAERVRSILQSDDGRWRVIVLEDGAVVWAERVRGSAVHIQPRRQGGIPEYDAAVKATANVGRLL
jgi:murein DD-endopeptidase MepM/ murein hydrolase activator NlpD